MTGIAMPRTTTITTSTEATMTTSPRKTRQRAALAALLEATSGFRTAQELHDQLRAAGHSVGIATVYRALQLMLDADEVDAIRTPDGQAAYRSCSARHHHHLICRDCGRTVEIQAPDFERWATDVATRNGFTDVDHELELFGRCTAHLTGPDVTA